MWLRLYRLGDILTDWQSVVCVIVIEGCKRSGVISYRDFNADEAKKCMRSSIPYTTTAPKAGILT